jgi:acyl-homoserine-lactone acylase
MKLFVAAATVALVSLVPSAPVPQSEAARWDQHARNVTIVRDDWGIAHVHGKTDADAIFGMIYAQAEDDFNRIETNFINSQGRLAEAEGEAEILARLAHEAVHRSRGDEEELPTAARSG